MKPKAKVAAEGAIDLHEGQEEEEMGGGEEDKE